MGCLAGQLRGVHILMTCDYLCRMWVLLLLPCANRWHWSSLSTDWAAWQALFTVLKSCFRGAGSDARWEYSAGKERKGNGRRGKSIGRVREGTEENLPSSCALGARARRVLVER